MFNDFPTINLKGEEGRRKIRINQDRNGKPLVYIDGAKFTLITPATAYEIADTLVDIAETIERENQ